MFVSTSTASPGFSPTYILSDKLCIGCDFAEFSESYVETILYIYLLRNAGISVRYDWQGLLLSSFTLEYKIANGRYIRLIRSRFTITMHHSENFSRAEMNHRP